MNKIFFGVDWILLLGAVLLVIFGLSAIYSLEPFFFRQQIIFLVIGIFLYWFVARLYIPKINSIWIVLYLIMNLSLIAILFFGVEVKGAVRWIEILGVRIQISEFIKISYILFLSWFLTQSNKHSLEKFIGGLLLTAPIGFLILREPDLGNALIIGFLSILMFFVYGFPLRYFITIFAAAGVLIPILFEFLHDYQRARITSFLNMSQDPFGSSYNAIQSLIAIGSGGFFGKGFGQSTQSLLHFLPEQHTDFIFATILESLGFVGGAVLLVLYSVIFLRIYKHAADSSDVFGRLVLFGCFFLLLIHVFFNMGMNIGILPIVGVTLPFVSYGGSSLITNFILLGIVSNLSGRRSSKLLEIR